jgi:Domain of unknown function (DUF2437)
MAINLARFATDSSPRWGVVQRNGIVPLSGDYPTTAALIEQGEEDWRSASRARWRSPSMPGGSSRP